MTPPPTSPIATLAVERAAGHAGLALVTGASGYLGGLLVPRLLEQGWRVRVLTRRRARLAGASWGDWVEILEGDAGVVRKLMASIAADSRHHSVKVFHEAEVDARLFESWRMAYLSPTAGQMAAWAGLPGATTIDALLRDLERDPQRPPQVLLNMLHALAR